LVVCGICGTVIGIKAAGGWIHLDTVGKEWEEHEAQHPTTPEVYAEAIREEFDVRLIAQEMLEHHLTYHPLTDCEWSQKLSIAVRKR